MKRSATTQGGSKAGALPLLGGHLALDFTNTVDWRLLAEPEEHLVDYAALLDWAGHVGLLDPAAPSELREAAYRLFRAEACGTAPPADDLAVLNRALLRFPRRGELVRLGEAYAWRSAAPVEPLTRPVERVVQAVGELLLAPERTRIRLCEGAGCGWLFLDTSPSRRRRWCSMEGCGNRAKARRYYERRRDSRPTSGSQ